MEKLNENLLIITIAQWKIFAGDIELAECFMSANNDCIATQGVIEFLKEVR